MYQNNLNDICDVSPYQPVGTNIPEGDKEKLRVMRTIHQVSYPEYDSSLLKCYDKDGVTAKLQQSNFKQKDGHGVWDTYLSTAAESYQPTSSQCKINAS